MGGSVYVTRGQGEDRQAVTIIELNEAGKTELSAELDGMIESAREASDFLKAMSHETRLLILCFLADGERSVSELEEFLSLKQSNVSQHLGRLRLDGLVKPRQRRRAQDADDHPRHILQPRTARRRVSKRGHAAECAAVIGRGPAAAASHG
jgi:DNA-binding transcriptional ArsR family regulator